MDGKGFQEIIDHRSRKPKDSSQIMSSRSVRIETGTKGHLCSKSPSGSHWWVIGSPDGAISDGVCRYCGVHKQFANVLDKSFVPKKMGSK